MTTASNNAPRFWRDPAMPFLEARAIDDGRQLCYARHSHEAFSIGMVTGGQSVYLNGRQRQQVGAGAVVVMNPQEVHACNPLGELPWSYRMFYVDVAWLTALQHALGFGQNLDFRCFSTLVSYDAGLYGTLARLYAICTSTQATILEKHSAAVACFSTVQNKLNPAPAPPASPSHKLARAAEYINDNCTRPLQLDEVAAAAGLSPSYLIRAFQAHYGMTPHAYLVNRRIQYSRARLRQGHPIANVALDAGFADQAHLQRAFKLHVAATPGQYRA